MDRKEYLKNYYHVNKERIRSERKSKRKASEAQIADKDTPSTVNLFNEDGQHVDKSIVKNCLHQECQQIENKKITDIYEFNSVSTSEVDKRHTFILICLGVLALFVIANTFFLVYEQVSFYILKSYNLYEAIFFSVLSEVAIITISFFSSFMVEVKWRVMLKILLVFSLVVVALIINTGVKKRGLLEQEKSHEMVRLQQEIARLNELERQSLENIASWDATKYKSKREKLLGELERGARSELRQKASRIKELLEHGSIYVNAETDVIQWSRYLALAWNVVLMHLLAYLLRREKVFVT